MKRYQLHPSPAQNRLLDELGGTAQVARLVSAHMDETISSQRVSNWRRRGIPWAFRACLAHEARAREIDIPLGFLGEARADVSDLAGLQP